MATDKRLISPGEMRALAAVNDALAASWQTKSTIVVVLVRLDGKYEGGFISALRADERTPPLLAGRVRVAVTPSTVSAIEAAIRSGQPVPDELIIETVDKGGEE